MGTQTVNPILNLLPLAMIFVVFYFMLIRPQRIRDKEHQKLLASLSKNDEVITSGGIHGTVVNVKDTSVVLRVDENVKMEFEKNCISVVTKKEQQKNQ